MAGTVIDAHGASRPYPGETANGDIWSFDRHNDIYRLAVIDGLGHGPAAAHAAQLARDTFTEHPQVSIIETLEACHRALRSTRGAAMFVATIDYNSAKLDFAGAGNVEGRLIQNSHERRLISQRGIVGSTLPRIRPVSIALDDDWLLIVHTDGVSNRLDPASSSADSHANLAERLLHAYGRETDDATIVVVHPSRDTGSSSDSATHIY